MDEIMSFLNNYISPTNLAIAVSSTAISATLSYLWYEKMREKELTILRPNRVIIITGCDTGLGLSMALWAKQLGYTVFAGVLFPQGEGANLLREAKIQVTPLDVTNKESIHAFRDNCSNFLEETGKELWAVISNAAVLVCAEFLWQSESQWERQFQVNFWGAVNLTKALQPLLFEHKSRLILISSDCSKLALPGLAIYAGSKAALEAWGRGLRLELGKYGVHVVSYQPGAFAFTSQIFAGHSTHYEQMEKGMVPIDKTFYGDYFLEWKKRKAQHSKSLPKIEAMESKRHQRDLKRLLEGDLRLTPVVTYETWVQLILLWGEKYLPRVLSDKLLKFVMNGGTDVVWKPINYANLICKAPK